jgi:hypothetical protein
MKWKGEKRILGDYRLHNLHFSHCLCGGGLLITRTLGGRIVSERMLEK